MREERVKGERVRKVPELLEQAGYFHGGLWSRNWH